MRRRPALVALSVACICAGGLASAWAWQSTSNTREVLTVRETVHRGEVIGAEDLVVVRIGVDPAIQPVPAGERSSLVGMRAALDIAAGSVVTASQLTDAAVPPEGSSVVGVSLTAGMLPVGQVAVGDKVRVVPTAGGQGSGVDPATQPISAVVVGLSIDEVTGNTLVNVQVLSADAAAVATAAAGGAVAVVLDSQAG
jgi:hypothetical protein